VLDWGNMIRFNYTRSSSRFYFGTNIIFIFCIGTMPATKFWPSLSVNSKKKNCNPYFIVIMITVLIMNVIFWVVNFKTENYFVIFTAQHLRLSMYDCSNFVHSCRIFGISELQTV
jgi:uncharacterized transporter YbjL